MNKSKKIGKKITKKEVKKSGSPVSQKNNSPAKYLKKHKETLVLKGRIEKIKSDKKLSKNKKLSEPKEDFISDQVLQAFGVGIPSKVRGYVNSPSEEKHEGLVDKAEKSTDVSDTIKINSKNQSVSIESEYPSKAHNIIHNTLPKTPENVIVKPKNSKIPDFSLDFTNTTNKPLKCVLFGHNPYLLHSNLGSDKGIVVKPSLRGKEYLQSLTQSAEHPIKTKLIKIISNNFDQLSEPILVANKDANGAYEETPIITASYITDDTNKVLPIDFPVNIDGNSWLSFTVLPKTKGTILFFAENTNSEEVVKPKVHVDTVEDIISFYNSLISCQIQQGLSFVALGDVDKFTHANKGQSIRLVDKLIKAGFIKSKNTNGENKIGVNFRVLTVSGKTVYIDLPTALKKSEYELKK